MPVSYQTGTYDQTVSGIFSSSVKQQNERAALAQVDVSVGELYANAQSASISSSGVQANNHASLIGVANPSVHLTDESGKIATSQASFVGVISADQSASIDRSDARADLSMQGVGYLFDGSTTYANDGFGNEAITKAGSFSGILGKNTQIS